VCLDKKDLPTALSGVKPLSRSVDMTAQEAQTSGRLQEAVDANYDSAVDEKKKSCQADFGCKYDG
jgi:hypothetical protein